MKNISPNRLAPKKKKTRLQLGLVRRNRVTILFRFPVGVTVRLVVSIIKVKGSVEDEV